MELELELEIKLVASAMNQSWYVEHNPDVKNSKCDPAEHFSLHGWKEGRNPSENFDTEWYLSEYDDVALANINPLVHYEKYGKSEGRIPMRPISSNLKMSDNSVQYQMSKQLDTICDDDEYNEEKANFVKFKVSAIPQEKIEPTFADDISYITLDIWDTVLRRKCHPDEIKYQSARFIFLEAFHSLKPIYRSLVGIYKARIKAENQSSMTDDFEYRFREAVPKWLKAILNKNVSEFKFEKLCKLILEHESQAEKFSIYADEPMKKFLNDTLHIPKVYISDFYLDTDELNKLLISVGLEHYFVTGYSSCEHALNKRSGGLYKYVLTQLDEAPKNILHIGDNGHADVIKANEFGLKSYHYLNQNIEKQRDWFGQAFNGLMQNDNKYHNVRLKMLTRNYLNLLPSNQDLSFANAGANLAPIAIGFVLSIIETAKIENIKEIFFLTREGQYLKELYDAIVLEDPFLMEYPESRLLEVSRLATFSASLREVSIKEMMRLWNQYSIQTPQAFVATLKLDEDVFYPLFEGAGFSVDQPIIYPFKNESFLTLFHSEEFNSCLKTSVAADKQLLKDYLANFESFKSGDTTMIVDIGWRGTIQDNICAVSKNRIHGAYLGLFNYLNTQPTNSGKSAWLFNENINDNKWMPKEVAPFEMLFNATGGSVVGYQEIGGKIEAIRNILVSEDKVVADYIQPIQKVVMELLPTYIDYIKLHGLMAMDLRAYAYEMCDELINTPDEVVARAFYELEHNEIFGTGQTDEQSLVIKELNLLKDKTGCNLHYGVEKLIKECRWPQAFLKLAEVNTFVNSLKIEQQIHLPSELFLSVLGDQYQKGMKVGFFVPGPLVGSGGHRTIFNLARKLYQFGAEIYIFLEDIAAGVEVVENYLQESKAHIFTQWHQHIDLDIAVATIAHSVRFVHELENAKNKAYLVQDFEAMFNPMGDGYHVAEQSYIYPTLNFTVGNWLTHVLKTQFAAKAVPGGLGCDTETYFPIENIVKEKAICFLYQPEKPRRSPQLAAHALKLVKDRHPDVKIYVYGSDAPLNLDFEVENLGLIHDLKEINALYNKCMVGLCISMSNPSRIPYELMAAGTVPVDIYRYNNLLDFSPGTSLLAYQSEFSISDAICTLFDNQVEYDKRRDQCIVYATSRTLNWEREIMFNSLSYLVGTGNSLTCDIDTFYSDEPFISRRDSKLGAVSFCEYQKSLARGNT
jgi:predicted HAD superfamily hydrolase/glycosyltransferase involved in cell wall biosynthesis